MRERGLPMLAPERVNAPEAVAAIAALRPDVLVVAAYGQLLGAPLLALPPLGCINVHASLLPRYRGAAPIQWAVINGETETGVTTMLMDAGMDTGDMLERRALAIGPEETAGELHQRLAVVGAEVLMDTLDALRRGTVTREAQDPAAATYAPRLCKADGILDWQRPARMLVNQVRGMNPWPCCRCRMPVESARRGGGDDGLSVRVLRARVTADSGVPGTVLAASPDGPVIACGEGGLCLTEVQPEGRRVVSGSAFVCGYRIQIGAMMTCERHAR